MLSDLHLHPYRPRLVQQLNDHDPDRRVEFCEKILVMVEEDNSILDKIIWTDEAIFKLNGHINRHLKILESILKETLTYLVSLFE
jgi:hypothetical protein